MNIQTVSKLTGLSAHTLRYYEKIDLLLNITRDSKGYRVYTENDLIWIEFIKRLKATNMPLKEIKKFALLRSKGDRTINDRLEILRNHQERVKRQMSDLLIHQKKIKEKIVLCKKGGGPSQK
jgi:DNA-binding transcriptional MerR regulator